MVLFGVHRVANAMALLFWLLLTAASASALVELESGWQAIATSEDMARSSISQLKGSCAITVAWGDFDARRIPSPTDGRWVRMHWQEDSRTIPPAAVGKGMWVYVDPAFGATCAMQTKGYADNLGSASRLSYGWNFISVTKAMVTHSLDEYKGCPAYEGRIFAPGVCPAANEGSEEEKACDGLYLIIKPDSKLLESYLGKAIWVWVDQPDGCILNDRSPGEVPAEGVNLIPVLSVTDSSGSDVQSTGSGASMNVKLGIKNTGTTTATSSGMSPGKPSIYNIIYFYTGREYGAEAMQPITAPLALFTPEKITEIAPGETIMLTQQQAIIPDAFTGDLVIVAAIDTQLAYPEANENDNRISRTIKVGRGSADIIATALDAFPKIEQLPATISSMSFTLKNAGEGVAAATEQFLVVKARVYVDNTLKCTYSRSDLVTLRPGETGSYYLSLDPANSQCTLDDKGTNYRVVVTVDENNVVQEKDEANTFTFIIKEQPACTEPGKREAARYCDVRDLKWKDQLGAGKPCSHNFECQSDMCIGAVKKCVSEEKKARILEITG